MMFYLFDFNHDLYSERKMTEKGFPMKTDLRKYAYLSIAAAVITIVLKTAAWKMTGSTGLLSDAVESLVNLAAALMALWALKTAFLPADDDHAFGHGKAEYFSSGVEGALIFIAAAAIIASAVPRLFNPVPLEQIGLGLALSLSASLVNLAVALVLFKAGKKHNSITLEADAHHLMSDVWTSAGVIVGIALTAATGWNILDPIVAILVAINILIVGFSLLKRSASGLMDTAIPVSEIEAIESIFAKFEPQQVKYHALRTRQSGTRRFVSVHVLVPGDWSVAKGHDILEQIEQEVTQLFPLTYIVTHLEPIGDPAAENDLLLDRD